METGKYAKTDHRFELYFKDETFKNPKNWRKVDKLMSDITKYLKRVRVYDKDVLGVDLQYEKTHLKVYVRTNSIGRDFKDGYFRDEILEAFSDVFKRQK